jgi:putative oxidoreductase
MKVSALVYWIARLIAAAIMAQTLFFKFSGAEESVEIFTKMGIEPWGRIGTGVMELIASVLLLINSTARWGALLACGLMAGAIGSHLFVLGIEVRGDGGYLFTLAWIVLLTSLYVLWVNRESLLKLFGIQKKS